MNDPNEGIETFAKRLDLHFLQIIEMNDPNEGIETRLTGQVYLLQFAYRNE